MELVVEAVPPAHAPPVEVVERKGLGHPDTLCDAIAERVSLHLCRHYVERFGAILHHNVDKVLLCGGAARPAFGGGEITAPIEIYLAGRVTKEWRGAVVPAEEIAVEACLLTLRERLPELDPARHVRVFPRLRPGSGDLASLFARGARAPLANDTSCGAGFAPLSDLERIVLAVERRLNAPETKRAHPAIGADVKVMGLRVERRVTLTIGCAIVGRRVADLADYVRATATVRELALAAARETCALEVEVDVNAADDVERGDVFLTVSGTSAEAGDDGEVGRGNRANGIITPYRWMTLEAAAGKNPVSHVGKIYGVLAPRLAARLVAAIPRAREAACVLLSRIGRAVDDPQMVHARIATDAPELAARRAVEEVVRAELAGIDALREELLAGRVDAF